MYINTSYKSQFQFCSTSQSKFVFTDSESGSDEEFVSREKMKMTAQALVDSKTKKKPTDDDDVAPKKRR